MVTIACEKEGSGNPLRFRFARESPTHDFLLSIDRIFKLRSTISGLFEAFRQRRPMTAVKLLEVPEVTIEQAPS